MRLSSLCACVLVFLGTRSSSLQAGEPLRVGTIHVQSLDLYTPAEASAGWPDRILNAAHVRTRESTIRKFLLFREGEPCDPATLAETERNLRQLPFIRSASVTAFPAPDGAVDVDVVTQDTWTTEPTVTVSRSGGVTTFGASFVERNLAGTGRELELTYDKGIDRITRYFAFTDPNLLGPYWNGSVLHAVNSDGREDRGLIQKPFSSVSTTRAGTLFFDASSASDRVYRDGQAAAIFRKDHHLYLAEYGAALARTPTTARRLTGGILAERDRFSALADRTGDPHPAAREHRYAFLRGEILRTELVKLDYVDRDARIDDFDTGDRVSLLAGISPAWFGLDRAVGLLGMSAARGSRPGRGTLLLPRVSLESRVGDATDNTILHIDARFIHRFGGALPQTLVSRLQILRGWDLDPESQFFADGSAGVRGYGLREYEGDRAAILNVEHRVFSGRELLRAVSPGAAVFFDAGIAASSDRDIRVAAVKSDIGVGLRLALPRASIHTLIRLDIAFPLNRDRDGRREPLVSFSNSQAF